MIEIRFEEDHNRSAAYDGDRLIGESDFSPGEKIWTISHTETVPGYEGQGIARKLVKKIVDEARTRNKKIVPLCPFAAREFERTPEYQDIKA